MFRILVISLLGFVIGAIATYAAVFFGTLGAWQVLGVIDRDGGGSMALAFTIAPIAALFGGSVTAVSAGVFAVRRRGAAPGSSVERRSDGRRFSLLAGVLAGAVAGYALSRFVFWLAGPIRYDAMWKAMAHAWAPTIVTFAGAVIGGLIVRRFLRAPR